MEEHRIRNAEGEQLHGGRPMSIRFAPLWPWNRSPQEVKPPKMSQRFSAGVLAHTEVEGCIGSICLPEFCC